MTPKNYALIKDGTVVNVIVFDNPDASLINAVKEAQDVDNVVLCEDNEEAGIGGTWDELGFIRPKPLPSWILVNRVWTAPVAKPTEGEYAWDEPTVSWIEIPTLRQEP